MSLVVRGAFLERIGPREREYAQGQFPCLPAGMVHSQTFGPTGARRLPVERVARLLLRPRSSIGEIALECGFSSHAHLCREFKAHYGVTPSRYRRDTDQRFMEVRPHAWHQ